MKHDTRSSLLRSTQALCEQVCERATLELGIAFCCDRYPREPRVNQFREIVADSPAQAQEAITTARRLFQTRGLECLTWASANGRSSEFLESALGGLGFVPHRLVALTLVDWRLLDQSPVDQGDSIRVLPARAMREAYRSTYSDNWTTALEAVSNGGCRLNGGQIEQGPGALANERLDDPQFDAFVALDGSQPVARGAIYQVGDFVRLVCLAICPRRLEVQLLTPLLNRLLSLARRLVMRRVMLQVGAEALEWRRYLHDCGFVEDGELVEFRRSGSVSPHLIDD